MNIEIEDLTHIYSGVVEQKIFDNLNLSTKERKLIGITGPSGVGKTTLINLLAGIIKPSFGKIFYDDFELNSQKLEDITEFRKKNIGLIFQDNKLFADLTVEENIRIPMQLNRFSKPKQIERLDELLNMVDLSKYKKMYPQKLSGGQQQRVAIAIALSVDPPIILADEPTGNLDPENAEMLIDIMVNLTKETETILIVSSHDKMVIDKLDTVWEISNRSILEK